jgi:hypothetical protein
LEASALGVEVEEKARSRGFDESYKRA